MSSPYKLALFLLFFGCLCGRKIKRVICTSRRRGIGLRRLGEITTLEAPGAGSLEAPGDPVSSLPATLSFYTAIT